MPFIALICSLASISCSALTTTSGLSKSDGSVTRLVVCCINESSFKSDKNCFGRNRFESGHNLLFGLCADGPLHTNEDDDRFASPLRIDPRPMDGIIHAAYVTARMHQSVQRLLDAGVLDEAQTREAREAVIANAKRFAMGMQTVDAHAKLTPLGETVMANARAYMARHL